MELTVQYFDGCPNWADRVGRLRELTAGRDDVAEPGRPVGLACRVYRTPDGPAGLPPLSQLADLLHA